MFRLRNTSIYQFILYLSGFTYTYLYLILYSPPPLLIYLLFFPIYLFHLQKESSLPHQYSFYTCRYLHILIYILSPVPFYPNIPHSFYTCRYLHILIYILPNLPSSSPNLLFPPSIISFILYLSGLI